MGVNISDPPTYAPGKKYVELLDHRSLVVAAARLGKVREISSPRPRRVLHRIEAAVGLDVRVEPAVLIREMKVIVAFYDQAYRC